MFVYYEHLSYLNNGISTTSPWLRRCRRGLRFCISSIFLVWCGCFWSKGQTLSFRSLLRWGASAWRRSKMWRSPSSPQIHQKYIYMWNNSHRTPTEHWQKTSDFPKALLLPFVLGFCLSVFFFVFTIVFSACYHWWIGFLVWLLYSFFLSCFRFF